MDFVPLKAKTFQICQKFVKQLLTIQRGYFYVLKSDRHLYQNIWLLEYFAIFFSKSTKRNAQEVYHSSTEKHNATTEEKEDDDDGSKIVVDRQGDKARSTEKTSFLLAYFFVTIIRSTNISSICGS